MSTSLSTTSVSGSGLADGLLGEILRLLPAMPERHAPGSELYHLLKQVARREIESLFAAESAMGRLGPFGDLAFPHHPMGAVTSLDLFDLDELILFAFYWTNRQRYRRVLDIGANLGLHAILLDRCGFEVRAFEPDPVHFALLERNLRLNRCTNVRAVNAAVSSLDGTLPFVRVLGNTTGSHLAGSKAAPYGALETFDVPVEGIAPLVAWADLVKLDAEGHEAEILRAAPTQAWDHTDALVEVGSAENAAALHAHFGALGVHLFAQKNGWARVHGLDDMPTSYRDGTLFVSRRARMPWAGETA